MANEYFTQNRAYFHSFGRAFSAEGQNFVSSAPLKAGHNLDTNSIRSTSIPYVDDTMTIIGGDYNGQSIFQNPSAGVGSRVINDNLSGILKFYDGVTLEKMPGTNDETWVVVDNGKQIQGFVDPTDVYSADGKFPALGYTVEILDNEGTKISPNVHQWTFDPFNGTVQFVKGDTPKGSWSAPKIRAFAFTGPMLETRLGIMEANIAAGLGDVGAGLGTVSGTLTTLINDETAARETAINNLSGAIGGEFTAENTVADALDTLSANLTEDLSTVSGTLSTAIETETTAREEAIDALSGAIGGEFDGTNTVAKAIEDLSTSLTEELSTVSGTLSAAIENEADARENGDEALSGAIGGEFDSTNTVAKAITDLGDTLTDTIRTVSGTLNTTIEDETTARAAADDFLSGVLSGFDTVGAVSSAIHNLEATAATYELSSTGNLAYALVMKKDGKNTVVGSLNIPEDQFLSAAVFGYSTANDSTGANWTSTKPDEGDAYPTLKLSFKVDSNDETISPVQDVYVPLHDLVDNYFAGNGLEINDDTNTFSVKIDPASESFLTVTSAGVKLSGVQEAINAANSDASEKIAYVSGVVSSALNGYLTADAVKDKFTEVDGKLTADETNIGTLSSALNDYTAANAVKDKFTEVDGKLTADETNISTLSSALDGYTGDKAVSSAFVDVNDKIDDANEAIGTLSAALKDYTTADAVSGAFAADRARLDTAESNITSIQNTLSGYDEDNTIADKFTEIEGQISSNNSGAAALSGALSGYTGANAVSDKFEEVDGKLSADEANIGTLSSTLTGFNAENTVSAKFDEVAGTLATHQTGLETLSSALGNGYTEGNSVANKFNDIGNDIDAVSGAINNINGNLNIVSGVVDTATVDGTINANNISFDVRVSDAPGNALSAVTGEGAASGLWVQKYVAGQNVTLTDGANGEKEINATYEYALSAATSGAIGGIKANDYIDVDANGAPTVKKVENSLTLFGKTYNGSETLSLNENSNYLSADTSTSAIVLDLIVNGDVAEANEGLIKGGQVYTVSSDLTNAIAGNTEDIATINSAISAAFADGNIVLGATDGITSSAFTIGTDKDTPAELGNFGETANVVATEASVSNYVNQGLDELYAAITTLNTSLEA